MQKKDILSKFARSTFQKKMGYHKKKAGARGKFHRLLLEMPMNGGENR